MIPVAGAHRKRDAFRHPTGSDDNGAAYVTQQKKKLPPFERASEVSLMDGEPTFFVSLPQNERFLPVGSELLRRVWVLSRERGDGWRLLTAGLVLGGSGHLSVKRSVQRPLQGCIQRRVTEKPPKTLTPIHLSTFPSISGHQVQTGLAPNFPSQMLKRTHSGTLSLPQLRSCIP